MEPSQPVEDFRYPGVVSFDYIAQPPGIRIAALGGIVQRCPGCEPRYGFIDDQVELAVAKRMGG